MVSLSWITPALTEACESVQFVEIVVGYNGRLRPSDDWPTLTVRTLRFNALLSTAFVVRSDYSCLKVIVIWQDDQS